MCTLKDLCTYNIASTINIWSEKDLNDIPTTLKHDVEDELVRLKLIRSAKLIQPGSKDLWLPRRRPYNKGKFTLNKVQPYPTNITWDELKGVRRFVQLHKDEFTFKLNTIDIRYMIATHKNGAKYNIFYKYSSYNPIICIVKM
jgi:hypothetical protein